MADETTAAVDEQVNEVIEPSESAGQPESTPDPEKSAEQPKPGTPDKALQKMQQELGNAVREIAALKEQRAETGELSETQKAKLAKAEQRVGKIRQFVNRPDRNELPTELDDVGEQVLELTEKVTRQDQLEAELKETKAQLAYLLNDHGWDKARNKYPGLDVDAIWEKAQKDAGETLADDATPRAVNRLASKWFEERCEAAKKRQGDDGKKDKPVPNAPPSQYKVSSGQRVAPQLSETDLLLQEARKLVVEI